MAGLGRKQGDVVKRSDLSKATVHEIQYNVKPRKRKRRTLQQLSIALDWHEDHLAAVLEGRTPPEIGKSFAKSPDDIPGRLDVIEELLDEIKGRLDTVGSTEERLVGFVEEIRAGLQQVALRLQLPER
jgi:hypothetical protein